MTPPITYKVELDIDRDGTFGSVIADITQYVVGQLTWNEGMAASYDEVAPPARLTFQLSNRSGDFNSDGYLSDELITNGNFDNWTAGVPDGWFTADDPPNSVVSQVASSSLFGEGGTGAVNLYNNGDGFGLPQVFQQNVFNTGRTYRLQVNITDSQTNLETFNAFGEQGFCGVDIINNVLTFARNVAAVQTHVFIIHIPDTITNSSARHLYFQGAQEPFRVNTTIDSVSLREVSRYRMVNKGMQVRLSATYNGVTSTLFQGRITAMQPTAGRNTEPLVSITVEDAMLELLDAEYAPPFLTDVTGDVALQRMFDDAVIRWPYSGNYWLLGVQGHSELDRSTYLYDHDVTNFETGLTEFAYVGDVEDRGNGISAQGYIRDILGGEAGGRFWFDPRTAKFIYHNRNHDALNNTIAGVYNESHFDSVVPKYGDDIVNDLTVKYTSREVGAAGSILWTLKSTPFLLKNNNQRKFNARYFDANNEQLHVGAQTTIQPQMGTDYVANTQSDGSGTVMSDKISVSVEASGNSAKVIVSNNSGLDVYVTLLQLRGTPVTQIEEQYQTVSGDSIAANELYAKVLEVRALDNASLAKQFGDYTIARFKNPIFRFESVTFNTLNYSGGNIMADAAINRLIGDKITITDSSSNHNKNYIIVGATHTLDTGGDKLHEVTWVLKPTERDQFWMLDTTGKSELDQTTYLAF